jgi:hypothetical protein
MKVVVVKKEKESNERLISRFNKRVQGSRKILKVKSERYNKRPETKRHKRASAIMREKYRTIREKNRFY